MNINLNQLYIHHLTRQEDERKEEHGKAAL